MSRPKISIITVVYNNLAGLQKSLPSVLGQDFDDFEYIVVDGASTDGTAEYLRSQTDSRLRFISEPDKGIFDAQGKGLRMAQGQFATYLDSGNWYVDATVLSRVAQTLTEDTQFISMPYIHEKKQGETLKWKVARPDPDPEHLYLAFDLFLHSAFARRELLAEYISEAQKYKCSGDHALVLKMYTEGVRLEVGNIVTVYFEDGGVSSDPRKIAYREDRQIAMAHGVPAAKAWLVYLKRMTQFNVLVLLRKLGVDNAVRRLAGKSPDLKLEQIMQAYCDPFHPWFTEECRP